MLTGSELLTKVASLGQLPDTQAAITCGYATAEGKPKVAAFKEALLAAYGLSFAKPTRAPGAGKPLSYNVACQKNGNVILSAGYGTLLGLVPGDRVDITHDEEAKELVLAKATAA